MELILKIRILEYAHPPLIELLFITSIKESDVKKIEKNP